MFEHRTEALLPWPAFVVRIIRQLVVACGVVLTALLIGVLGYRGLEGLPWTDALLNASMILGGMGPVNALHTEAGKLFASAYALFSGVVLLAVAGLLFLPVFHRLLHHFHLEMDERDEAAPTDRRRRHGR